MNITRIAAMSLLVLAGCGKPPAPQVSPPRATPTPAESKELRVFCRPEAIPQPLIAQFTKETGIAVSVENHASKEEMLARLLHGSRYDIILSCEDAIGALAKDGMLHPLDHAGIPNWKNIAPIFLNRSFDPGNVFSVPFLAAPVGIVVNTEKNSDDIRGIADVFAEKNSGDIVVPDDAREIVTLGFLAQGTPINQATDEALEKARPLLAKWLPLVKVSDSPMTVLLNGGASVGVIRGGEAAVLLNADKKFKWVIPAEGAHLAMDSLAIPKAAENVANAGAFINFLLRPDISRQASDALPSLNPNVPARALLSPSQRANPASFPTDQEVARMQTFEDVGEQASKFDAIVTAPQTPR
ncbi:MAG: spermidine/putrescine ABC transporter substrate-binding protein [Verrucomicrobiae bacterium]